MSSPITIAECKEPWIYWWQLLTASERITLKEKHFPESWPDFKGALFEHEKRTVWEHEKPNNLQDYDWIALADDTFRDAHRFTAIQTKEIWRQVYRIASEKI